LLILSLSSFFQDWIKGCYEDKGISSFVELIYRFIEFVKPQCQTYEESLQNCAIALEDEGFITKMWKISGMCTILNAKNPLILKERFMKKVVNPLNRSNIFPMIQ
jgi:hypothetical protein